MEMINELNQSDSFKQLYLRRLLQKVISPQNDDLTPANFNLKSDGHDAYASQHVEGSDD